MAATELPVKAVPDDGLDICLAVMRIFNHHLLSHGHILISQLDNVAPINHKSRLLRVLA
jgi:hypothetical protein